MVTVNMATESHNDKLSRIETKLDKITESVHDLATVSAVIHTKVEDLEVRRNESHERANRFSEKLDHMHGGIHELDTEMHGLASKLSLTTKLVLGVGSIGMAAIINQAMNIL
jgi:chromosome segregation ATPase